MNFYPHAAPSGHAELDRHRLALGYSGIVTWVWDLRSDLVECDEDFFTMFELEKKSHVTAAEVLGTIHIDDRPIVEDALQRCFDSKTELYDCRFRAKLKDGSFRWLRGCGQVIERSADGSPVRIVGTNSDFDDVAALEERLRSIAGEMRHRVKNSLSMVSALVKMTARETDNINEFLESITGRVDAIAAAQQIESENEHTTGSVAGAIEGALSPFKRARHWQSRISVHAPDCEIRSSASQALTLALYELATNSVKYGALKSEQGTIEVTATYSPHGLKLFWSEKSANIEATEIVDGFGSKLIDRLIRSERGVTERSITDGHLSVSIQMPLSL
ncbi:MAG: HWE histidine kinase domain-containing protein [Pseudomonadota bacterium]